MGRLHAPDGFFRLRGLREGMRAREEPWRLLADGPHRLASRQGGRWLTRRIPPPPTRKGPLWPLPMLSRRMALIGANL